jgi:hypothetical protein
MPMWLLAGLLGAVMPSAGSAETVSLFNGKNLDGWVARGPAERNKWVVGQAQLDPKDPTGLALSMAGPGAGQLVNVTAFRKGSKLKRDDDLYTVRKFADCTIRLEFMLPKAGNSGVYVMGEYELQLKDSYGQKDITYQDLGAIYKAAPARGNAARKPGEWQTLVIEFQAPRFRDGVKVSNARFVKVVLNGQIIHENVEMKDVTPGGLTKKEVPAGPILLQGDHAPVAFRSITVTEPTGK